MKKIVSYSLWGNNPKYTIGAIKNAHLVNEYYPGWVARFYCGKSTPEEIVAELRSIPNTEVLIMDNDGDWTGMFWRFYAGDGDDICISRDTDSRIGEREVSAVNEWLMSDKDFHIMRDHPWHGHVIMGGMWGARNGILKGIIKEILKYKQENRYMIDQDFMANIVYSKIKDKCMIHDPFFEKKPFPIPRKSRDFVGKPYNSDDTECDTKHADLLGNML